MDAQTMEKLYSYKSWGWFQQKGDDDDEDWNGFGGDGNGLVEQLEDFLHKSDNIKLFFQDDDEKKYQARFKLFARGRGEFMIYSELIEFLTSINIIMSEKILEMLYNNLSERNDNQGITYEDVRIIIIKKKQDDYKK